MHPQSQTTTDKEPCAIDRAHDLVPLKQMRCSSTCVIDFEDKAPTINARGSRGAGLVPRPDACRASSSLRAEADACAAERGGVPYSLQTHDDEEEDDYDLLMAMEEFEKARAQAGHAHACEEPQDTMMMMMMRHTEKTDADNHDPKGTHEAKQGHAHDAAARDRRLSGLISADTRDLVCVLHTPERGHMDSNCAAVGNLDCSSVQDARFSGMGTDQKDCLDDVQRIDMAEESRRHGHAAEEGHSHASLGATTDSEKCRIVPPDREHAHVAENAVRDDATVVSDGTGSEHVHVRAAGASDGKHERDTYLEGLNPPQRLAATHDIGKPLLILAGPCLSVSMSVCLTD